MSHPYESFMREAAELAERGRWSAAPNPTVGAVLVRDGVAVARGWHTAYGKSHAEVECLKDAEAKGVDPSACTLVVTLEPCNHQGQTPPCTEAVIAAGIRHVVIGLRDPNPKAAGGMERLAEAGVEVEAGVCEELCRDLVADFLIWQTTKRPYVMLKLAMTLDGRIATRTGHSRWITGETARHQVHELRANVGRAGGAILVGGNTLHTDNPLLTARLDDPVERQPRAVSISSRVPAPDSLLLFKERPTETIFLTTASGAATPRAAQLRERGGEVGSADNRAGIFLFQRGEVHRNAVGAQGGGDDAVAPLPLGNDPVQQRRHRRGCGVDEIAEDMHAVAAPVYADLNAGHDLHAACLPGGERLRNAGGGVVVRHGDGGETELLRHENHLRRRAGSVGGGGVDMQIDALHARKPFRMRSSASASVSPRVSSFSS